jgi:hypothetical protein
MSQETTQFTESERTEFEAVVGALAKWPRLSHLLRYMGNKLFADEVDQLNEYNIATEVLGRSRTAFNASEDAIARVETHRLRKRLTEFYEKEGKNHAIQVTLPAGSYVPVFIHKPEGATVQVSPDENKPALPIGDGNQQVDDGSRPAAQLDDASEPALPTWNSWPWKYWILAVVLLIAVGKYLYVHTREFSARERPVGAQAPVAASLLLQSEASSSTIRLLAGYSGQPRMDSVGRIWGPDQYFSAGSSWRRSPGFIARTSDPFLFENSRTGDFSYSIPLKPGSYEMHLFFSTPLRSDEALSFNVSIRDKWLLQAFDINADALGENIADERVFRDVSPDKDGSLHIGFSGATGAATLNAIEILPGVPRTQLPIRLVMQTTPFTDSEGRFWHSDNYFMNGRLSHWHPLPESADPDLFSRERYGHFTYAIPVDTRGTYTLILHFVEFYFGPGASGGGGTGSRLFKVMCNGNTLLDNFDIFKEAGGIHEVTKTFRHMKPTAQGKLNLVFEPIVNNATVSGIEVLDESQ